MRRFGFAVLALLCAVAPAWAQTPVVPSQAGNSKNQEVAAVQSSAVVTLTAPAHTRAHLYQIQARCSAGSAGITISDGVTQIWSTAATTVGTSIFNQTFQPGMVGTLGNTMTITLSTCGGGNTGTLDVQADIY